MPAPTTAQVQEALRRVGYRRAATATDIAAARRFGLGAFGRTRAPAAGSPVAPAAAPEPAASPDITQQFIDQLRPLFTRPNQPEVKPFEGSGFYNEADTRSLADQEYDPFYQRQREDDERRTKAEDYGRLEEVNASGGFRSSAYQQEMERRKLALQRAAGEQDTQKRLAKEQFAQTRRGEAYQRYLQSVGAVTS